MIEYVDLVARYNLQFLIEQHSLSLQKSVFLNCMKGHSLNFLGRCQGLSIQGGGKSLSLYDKKLAEEPEKCWHFVGIILSPYVTPMQIRSWIKGSGNSKSSWGFGLLFFIFIYIWMLWYGCEDNAEYRLVWKFWELALKCMPQKRSFCILSFCFRYILLRCHLQHTYIYSILMY